MCAPKKKGTYTEEDQVNTNTHYGYGRLLISPVLQANLKFPFAQNGMWIVCRSSFHTQCTTECTQQIKKKNEKEKKMK